jgi:hypothetical protein
VSSASCAPCLRLEPRISRWLLFSGGVSHILAGAAVVVSSLPWWVKIGFIIGIALSWAWFGYCYGYSTGPRFITRVEWLDGRWRLETGAGGVHHGQLIGGYAHPLIVILNFQLDDGGRRSLTLLPDSADPDDLRRMRVWLRTRPYDDEPEPP